MKRALAFALLMAGSPLDAGEIVQKPLDEFVIYNIPVACQSGNTTVLFPSAISGLYAKSVAVQEQSNADFVLSFTPGNFYFTVRALKKDAEDHLTVIYNRKAYVLHLSASEKPFYSVTFFQGGNTRAAARPVVPERLLSLLDKAKAYPLFQKDHPDALAGVLHAAPNATNYYDNFTRGHSRRVAVRGGGHPDLPHRPRKHVGQHDLLQTPGPRDPARRPDLHAVPCRRVRRDAAEVHDAGIFRDHRQRNRRPQQSRAGQQVERACRPGGRPAGGRQMNARKIWTELFQKPAGRLVLFLLVGAIFLAFILMRRTPQPKPDNTPVASQATQAKSYSFKEDIQPPSRTQATPSPRESDKIARATPTPKPPPPIPQTIFATREQSVSEWFLPYGRLLRCELVNTVDSTNIDTPIIGLVIEDVWNDGRVIIPAGTEVHGVAQKSPVRERIGSDRQWFLVFQDGRELPISGSVLDYAPKNSDSWAESDGSAGLRGFIVKSDKYAEAKAILAAMISAGAGAFPETTTLISPLGGATQLNNGGIDSAFSAGLQAGGQLYSKRLLERLDKDPFYVRVPAGTTFYLYVTQTVDLGKATVGLSASIPPPTNPTHP